MLGYLNTTMDTLANHTVDHTPYTGGLGVPLATDPTYNGVPITTPEATRPIEPFTKGIGWLLIMTVSSLIASCLTYHYYSDWKRPLYVTILTIYGWTMCFAVIFLVPIDVSAYEHRQCLADHNGSNALCDHPVDLPNIQALYVLWNVVYWSAFFGVWFIYPIGRQFNIAGDFTVPEKFRTAFKMNLFWYAIGSGICILLFVAVVAYKFSRGEIDHTPSAVIGLAIALANSWGLLLLVLFAGYGLVHVPRVMWRSANDELQLRYFQYQASVYAETIDKANEKLTDVMNRVKAFEDQVESVGREGHPLRRYLDIVVGKLPKSYSRAFPAQDQEPISYKNLASIHQEVLYALKAERQAVVLARENFRKAHYVEDIISSRGQGIIHWTHRAARVHRFANLVNSLEYYWLIHARPIALRVLSIVCALLTIMIVWSELLFSIDESKITLSAWALIIRAPRVASHLLAQQFFVFVPFLYIAGCSYFALFKWSLFDWYAMVPHGLTDDYSLMWCAAWLVRLVAPMAYNFQLMTKLKPCTGEALETGACQWDLQTAAFQVMGVMNAVPLLGEQFNVYFPVIMAVVCIITVTNLWSRVMSLFRVKKFMFSKEADTNDPHIEEGVELVRAERERRMRDSNGDFDDDIDLDRYTRSRSSSLAHRAGPSSKFPEIGRRTAALLRESGREELLGDVLEREEIRDSLLRPGVESGGRADVERGASSWRGRRDGGNDDSGDGDGLGTTSRDEKASKRGFPSLSAVFSRTRSRRKSESDDLEMAELLSDLPERDHL